MAGRTGSTRVLVASRYLHLAKYVEKLLPQGSVVNIPYNSQTFDSDLQQDDVRQKLQETEVMLCDRNALFSCLQANAIPRLKWAQTTSGGVDELVKKMNFQKPSQDFILTRTGQGFGEVMAEYVVGHIIAREKDFAGMMLKQQQREWSEKTFIDFRALYTLSIGILGYGAIGKVVGDYCKATGMTVWAVNRTKKASVPPNVDYTRTLSELAEVLEKCDYVCNVLPDTPDTVDLLSGDVLKHCKNKKSILINMGRGTVISDDSLVRAVREGWIGGAILDVFNEEPLPADNPLWSLPGVTITPHMSGPSRSDLLADAFVRNLELYKSGQPLKYVFDWTRGY